VSFNLAGKYCVDGGVYWLKLDGDIADHTCIFLFF